MTLNFKILASDAELLAEALAQQKERELRMLRGRLVWDYPDTR